MVLTFYWDSLYINIASISWYRKVTTAVNITSVSWHKKVNTALSTLQVYTVVQESHTAITSCYQHCKCIRDKSTLLSTLKVYLGREKHRWYQVHPPGCIQQQESQHCYQTNITSISWYMKVSNLINIVCASWYRKVNTAINILHASWYRKANTAINIAIVSWYRKVNTGINIASYPGKGKSTLQVYPGTIILLSTLELCKIDTAINIASVSWNTKVDTYLDYQHCKCTKESQQGKSTLQPGSGQSTLLSTLQVYSGTGKARLLSTFSGVYTSGKPTLLSILQFLQESRHCYHCKCILVQVNIDINIENVSCREKSSLLSTF